MSSHITRGQRIGLGIVAMFYGQMVAAVLLALAIVLRQAGHFAFARAHLPWLLRVILVSVALEACIAAVSWLAFVSGLLAAWGPERLRDLGVWLYSFAIAVGVLAIGVLWLALWIQTHRYHMLPRIPLAFAVVTFGYTAVATSMGLWRYLGLAREAEEAMAGRKK